MQLRVLAMALMSLSLAAVNACAQAERLDTASSTVLTLLGTRGGPGPLPDRAGIASLVTVGERHYLIDAGGGVTEQLAKAGVPVSDIDTVFLTHLHDDHTASLPALMTYALMAQSPGMTIHGPAQTGELVARANDFIAINARIRRTEMAGRFELPDALFKAKEFDSGVVFDDGTVTVTAVANTHYKLAAEALDGRTQSYALRFDTPDRSIVFTGDTGPSGATVELARGADILVAEMISLRDTANVPEFLLPHLLQEHLTAEEVGKLASAAGVGTVVASHVRGPSEADAEEIARHFDGHIVIGEDLHRF